MILALLAAAAISAAPSVTSVTREDLGGYAIVRLSVEGGRVPEPRATRDGEILEVTLPGVTSKPGLELPRPSAPVEELTLRPVERDLVIRLRVPGTVRHQLRPSDTALAIVLGGAPAGDPSRSVADLYARLFPAGQALPPGPPPLEPSPEENNEDESGDGIPLGPLRLAPSAQLTYVRARSTFGPTAEAVEDEYLEFEPRLLLDGGFLGGALRLGYEPRFRRLTSFEAVRQPSHIFNGALEVGLGPALTVKLSDHYAIATLEALEADAGREYFFNLQKFHRNLFTAGVTLDTQARLFADFSVAENRLTFDETAGFVSYRARGLRGSAGYQLTPKVRTSLFLAREHVEPLDQRLVTTSDTRSLGVRVQAEIGPLVTTDVSLGWQHRDAPESSVEQTFDGYSGALEVKMSVSPETQLRLTGSRTTRVSAFADNAFFAATNAEGEVVRVLRGDISLRAAGLWQRNEYPLDAAGRNEPRIDRILSFSVGAGKAVTEWLFGRVDFRKDFRDSNLDIFDTTTHALTFQVGITPFRRSRT